MKYIFLLLLAFNSTKGIAQDKKPIVQCKGTTVKGVQCMRKAKEGTKDNAYCSQHNLDAPRCAGHTGSGVRCKRIVAKEGDKCHDHVFQKRA